MPWRNRRHAPPYPIQFPVRGPSSGERESAPRERGGDCARICRTSADGENWGAMGRSRMPIGTIIVTDQKATTLVLLLVVMSALALVARCICGESFTLMRVLQSSADALGFTERCAVASGSSMLWLHCRQSGSGGTAPPICPDIIFGKDRASDLPELELASS